MVKSINLSDKELSGLCVGLGLFLEKYKMYTSDFISSAFNNINF
jgi:hypothetical protein